MEVSMETTTENYTLFEAAYSTLEFPLPWFNVFAYGAETTVSRIGNDLPLFH